MKRFLLTLGLVAFLAGPVFAAGTVFHSGTANAVVSNTVASFWQIDGSGTGQVAAAEGDATQIQQQVANCHNLTCALYTAGGVLTVAGGTSYVMVLRQNIASSALTCTIAAAASSCSDLTHQVPIAVLDQLDFGDTPNGTPTALVPKCTMQCDY